MMIIWPGGWTWEPRQPEYEQMILGIYVVLGTFMVIASRKPESHRLFIRFVVWSSLIHGGIMATQAFLDSTERANQFGDVLALFLMAGVLAYLMPRDCSAR